MNISKEHWWILNSVLEVKYPLDCLADAPELLERNFNRDGHGLSRDQLRGVLGDLFGNGLLKAIAEHDEVEPTSELIENGLSANAIVYYCLTPAGGAVWEDLAHASWNCYLQVEGGDEPNLERLASSNQDLCKRYYRSANHAQSVDEPPITMIAPWNATYWKSLPVGYVMEFELDSEPWISSRVLAPFWYSDYFDKCAEPRFEQAYASTLREFGYKSEQVGSLLLDIGHHYLDRGYHCKSARLCEEASAIFEQTCSPRLDEAIAAMTRATQLDVHRTRWNRLSCRKQ